MAWVEVNLGALPVIYSFVYLSSICSACISNERKWVLGLN